MGVSCVTLPMLSTSNSEDNMSLGDKDSIRRRPLWALEGKPSPDGFSPVEIPELSTPEIERRISELVWSFPFFISCVFSPTAQQASSRSLLPWTGFPQA
jgi:hypothetical protein